MKEILLDDLKREFKEYFLTKKPDYKNPGPLFGMAFYITRNDIGINIEDLFSGKTTLEQYGSFLLDVFKKMNSSNPYGRMSAYKDAMKNLLEFIKDFGYQDVKIIDLPKYHLLNNETSGGVVNKAEDVNNSNDTIKQEKAKTAKSNNKYVVPKPTIDEVKHWLSKWEKLEDYVAQEKAIDKLFLGEFNSNDDLQNILIKCSVLNDFYSTNIFKIYPVAKHILELNVDERLRKNDMTLVDDIAKVVISDTEKNFYSFASKYCSHHKPLEYPIYDSYVGKMLLHFKKVYHFYSFDKIDLKNYTKFKTILIKFREYFNLEIFNLKELDKYLWQAGKAYFPKTYY